MKLEVPLLQLDGVLAREKGSNYQKKLRMNPDPEIVLSTASYLEQYGWYIVICAIGLYVVWNKFQSSIKSTPSESRPPNGETLFQCPHLLTHCLSVFRCLPA